MQHVAKTDMKKENVTSSTIGAVSTELEETKEKLQKAKEEGNYMANCVKSLEEQLEETKRELRNLKAAKDHQQQHTKAMNPEVEEVEFYEINANANNNFDDNRGKKIVTFASPPSLTREIKQSRLSFVDDERASKFGRSSSFKKEGTKKPVVAIMGWLFPKKKRINYQGDLDRSPQV
ncbi:hypothetical protein SOVF_202120, partial [Spinacia oleracea]